MKKILIIDDDEQIRDMLGLYLKNAGYNIITAEDGKTGEDLYLSQKPDLLIM